MKALVLSGGSGTRLRPLSHTMPKQLVPIANKPVLAYGLEAIAGAGITEVGIVVGDRIDDIREAVGDGSRYGLRVTYLEQAAPLGLAHAVVIAREFLGDDDFLMYLGDNVVLDGIDELVARFRADPCDAQVTVHPADPREGGLAVLDADGRVTAVEEKPKNPVGNLALMGIYVFTPLVHQAVRAIRPSARGELEITDAIGWLIEQGHHVRGHHYRGFWRDAGLIDSLLECNQAVLDHVGPRILGKVDDETEVIGRVFVDERATVTRSRLVGPLVIGPEAIVDGSYVGPYTSVGEQCVIEDSSVEFSIVMDRALIREVRGVHGSLIGRATSVRAAAEPARGGHRLVLGENSQVLMA
ncbi:glucose-1-phosphate thymidylyltransferase [Sphaerisporangium rufum]|uniref:Glucose-1-phosphate thymidylyltransferase n=1 Tax=Sphaerisporangium rufum TaxID=1381558 RepID=A0A919R844_9ACTN|nr:glucose-1-phosphate thymidylyltransferase [Sphaerisporangium rufum]GII80963.1 glucose-1-phosphate thymidylyltransferase [Sphaerisporangium rufum]